MFRCGYIAFSGSANNALQDSWTEEYILDVARKTWLDIICKLEGKLRNQRNRAAGTLLNGRNTRAFRKMTVLLEAAQLRLIRESTMSKQPLWFGWNDNSRGTEAVSFSLRTPLEWYFTKKRSLVQWLYGVRTNCSELIMGSMLDSITPSRNSERNHYAGSELQLAAACSPD